MTAVALRQCVHLATGKESAYVRDGADQFCLNCACHLYQTAPRRYAGWQHVYLMVTEARAQKRGKA